MPYIKYEKKGNLTGRYPVYHRLTEEGKRVFLYYYINEIPEYPEKECKDRGCWVISKSTLREIERPSLKKNVYNSFY